MDAIFSKKNNDLMVDRYNFIRRTKLTSLAFHFKQVIAFDWLQLINKFLFWIVCSSVNKLTSIKP